MKRRYLRYAWLIILVEALWVNAATPTPASKKADIPSARTVPLDLIEARHRDAVRQVLEKPILAGRGPAEAFYGQPDNYTWFLDHPDRAVVAWRRLGAKCVSIHPRGDNQFGWSDESGSELVWEAVHRGPNLRIWFAEGKIRPGPVLPLVPVKAVVVLRHSTNKVPDGTCVIQHQSDLFVQTDSKTAAMVTRMMGPSANRATEQGLGQLQLFFSGLCWYLDRHPEQTETLLKAGE